MLEDRKRWCCLLALLAVAFMSVVVAAPAEAQWDFFATQITETSSGWGQYHQMSDSGSVMVFEGKYDPFGKNADGNIEVFLYDFVNRSLVQVSESTSGGNRFPDLSLDGEWVTFWSSDDLVPGKNVDGNGEIFRYRVSTSELSQITETAAGASISARLSRDGSRIVLHSSADLTGGNPDGGFEIFYTDDGGSSFTQVTDSPTAASSGPDISPDGDLFAFSSQADLVGGGNADGNREVFLFDVSLGSFDQLTDTTGCSSWVATSEGPSFAAGETLLLVNSTCDLVPGGNADGSWEAFVLDLTSEVFEQITWSTGGSTASSISRDGRYIGVDSEGDLTGANPDLSLEVFFVDRVEGTTRQLTDGGDADTEYSYGGGLRGDGMMIVFASGNDPFGSNPEGNDETFAAFPPPVIFADSFEFGALSAWSSAIP